MAGIDITDDLRDLLYAYDPRAPLEPVRRSRETAGGLVRERVSFMGAGVHRVPAVLVYHRAAPVPRPVLLIEHGLNAGKDDERIALLRDVWAEHGFACVSIDLPMHGERADSPIDVLAMFAQPYRGLHFVQDTVVDLCRTVDYLASRPDIDTGRLAYVGFSMSTFLGVQFVAEEPRVRAACFAMGGAGLFHFLVSRSPAESRADQELVATLIDPLHYAPRIAPRPVLQVNGLSDTIIPAALGHMLHGALAEPKRMLWYPGGHDGLPETTVEEMRRFLAGALGMDAAPK